MGISISQTEVPILAPPQACCVTSSDHFASLSFSFHLHKMQWVDEGPTCDIDIRGPSNLPRAT